MRVNLREWNIIFISFTEVLKLIFFCIVMKYNLKIVLQIMHFIFCSIQCMCIFGSDVLAAEMWIVDIYF